ncbi:MAG: hypothetical protein ABSE16_20425 [Verrucomicrobiota bacterium]|jgi:hypothetical protein
MSKEELPKKSPTNCATDPEIEATQDFMTWTIISTVTVGSGGSLDFTDTNAAGFPQRFYRTQQTP